MSLPHIPDPAAWPAIHALPIEAWRPALDDLARAWSVRGAWSRLRGGEDSAVFAAGGDVVKFVPPFNAVDAAREVAVLRRLKLAVPTPIVRDVTEADGWTVVRMSRVPGASAEQLWASVGRDDRVRLLHELGAVLRSLWTTALDPSDGDPAASLSRWRGRVSRHRSASLVDPEGFVAQHLPRPSPPPALMHLDLNDGNVMLERRGGRWEVAGVLDFVTARAFYPPADLVTPALFLGRGDPVLLHALLEGAGSVDLPPTALAAWHLVHPLAQLSPNLALGGRCPSGDMERDLEALWTPSAP